MVKPNRNKKLNLLRLLAEQRRSSLFPAGLLTGLVLVAVGAVMLLLPVIGKGDVFSDDVLSVQDVAMMVFGCAGITVGFFLFMTSTLAQLAHEFLLILENDCNRVYGTVNKGNKEAKIPNTAKRISGFQSRSKSKLGTISTRDLSAGWRILVIAPLVVGGLLLLTTIYAWLVPGFDAFLLIRGVRLEYLCLGGLMFLAVGAYMLIIFGCVHLRRSKQNLTPR